MSSATRPETVPNFRRPAAVGWAGRDAGDRFSICLERLFAHEGGFNNLKADRGGATNFGISLRFLQGEAAMNAKVRGLLPPGPVTADTIRALGAETAAQIYLWCFWAPSHCDRLPYGVDGMVFDQAVNGGRTTGIRLLQRAINRAGNRVVSVLEDGQIGQRTLDAARKVPFLPLRAAFRAVAAERYVAIVDANPSQAKFLKGWLNRAAALGDV